MAFVFAIAIASAIYWCGVVKVMVVANLKIHVAVLNPKPPNHDAFVEQ